MREIHSAFQLLQILRVSRSGPSVNKGGNSK